MIGRVHLIRGNLAGAVERLEEAIDLAERERWLAFLPWPQALLGEAALRGGDPAFAVELLDQAFARACQLGDPCWEGMSARGLALAAEAGGDTDEAFRLLADARVRGNRLVDAYVWLDVYILDALCELGIRHGHPDTGSWVAAMQKVASRTSMREMTVRSLLHGAALGDADAGAAASLIARDIDNPELAALLAAP